MLVTDFQARTGKTGGFSLIELLVVITILSVLIAMLLPTLSTARAVSQSVKCMSNERQIGLATRAYTGENKEWWMVSAYPFCGHSYHYSATWAAVVAFYGNNPYKTEFPTNALAYPEVVKFTAYGEPNKPKQGILKCPSSTSTNTWGGPTSVSYGYNSHVGGLGVNDYFTSDSTDTYGPINGPIYKKYYGRVRTPEIYREANTIHIADMVTQGGYEYSGYQMGSAAAVDGLHPNETANLLFTDGHAENRKTNAINESEFVRY